VGITFLGGRGIFTRSNGLPSMIPSNTSHEQKSLSHADAIDGMPESQLTAQATTWLLLEYLKLATFSQPLLAV